MAETWEACMPSMIKLAQRMSENDMMIKVD